MQQSEIAKSRDTFALQRKYDKAKTDTMNAVACLAVLFLFAFIAAAPAAIIILWKAAL